MKQIKTTPAKKNDAKKGELIPFGVVFSLLGLAGSLKVPVYNDVKKIDKAVEELNKASQAFGEIQKKEAKALGHDQEDFNYSPEIIDALDKVMTPKWADLSKVSKEDVAFIEPDQVDAYISAGMTYRDVKLLGYWLVK